MRRIEAQERLSAQRAEIWIELATVRGTGALSLNAPVLLSRAEPYPALRSTSRTGRRG
mgnify:CR=1 FL=1